MECSIEKGKRGTIECEGVYNVMNKRDLACITALVSLLFPFDKTIMR